MSTESLSELEQMRAIELQQLKENYIEHIIDGMDLDDLICMCRDLLIDAYSETSWDDMCEEIKDLYDEETLIDLIPEGDNK